MKPFFGSSCSSISRRLVTLGALLVLVCASAACFQPWPGRPPKLAGDIAPAIAGDEAIVAKLRSGGDRYPTKAYWIAEPKWLPVRSPMGIVTGRYTENQVIALVTRYDGSPDGWPDLCQYREISLKEVATDQAATEFAKTEPRTESRKGEIDCAVYDAVK